MANNPIVIQPEPADDDKIEKKFIRSADGRKAHNRGKLAGALLGRAAGADRVSPDSNLYSIGGQDFRIHTISNGTMSFSFNPATEPPRLIVALAEINTEPGRPVRYRLFGELLADCIRAGTASKTRSAPMRLSVSLSVIPRTRLGDAHVPLHYTDAATVADRLDLMDEIEGLSPEALAGIMDDLTTAKVRAFVLRGREDAIPESTPVPAPPAVDAVSVAAADPVPAPPTAEAPTVAGRGPAAVSVDGGPQITDPSALPPGGDMAPEAEETPGESAFEVDPDYVENEDTV